VGPRLDTGRQGCDMECGMGAADDDPTPEREEWHATVAAGFV